MSVRPYSQVRPHALPWSVWSVLGLWFALAVVGAAVGSSLDRTWSNWHWAFWAAAVWGGNLVVLVLGIGGPFGFGRIPVLSAAFAGLMTIFGSASYWVTVQLYPDYEVNIERAAFFVALCTLVSLGVCAIGIRGRTRTGRSGWLEWDWGRLQAMALGMFIVAAVGTVLAIRRIGYIPVLSGDPESIRVAFPSIGGIWYRLSMLGVVSALLAGACVVARRGGMLMLGVGLGSLFCVGLYGPRFFVVLPIGVLMLMWDRVRGVIPWRRIIAAGAIAIPALALVFFIRIRSNLLGGVSPIALILYGTLAEFRDLAWTIDHYGTLIPYLHGSTLPSAVVPLLPRVAWSLVGVDKDAVFAQNSANVLASEMGRDTGQRVGLFGELYANYGWVGALGGAVAYGILLAWLDRQAQRQSTSSEVRVLLVALIAATTIFAQVGQLNMFTSTLTAYGYPLLAVALIASSRRSPLA